MDIKSVVVALPLFEASKRITAALKSPSFPSFKAVVSRDGDAFWLHTVDDLLAASSAGQTPLFSSMQSRRLPVSGASAGSLDMMSPTADQVHAITQQFASDLVVTGIARGSTGDLRILVISDPNAPFNYVSQRYECSRFHETYDETVYKSNNGNCPKHENATLSPVP